MCPVGQGRKQMAKSKTRTSIALRPKRKMAFVAITRKIWSLTRAGSLEDGNSRVWARRMLDGRL